MEGECENLLLLRWNEQIEAVKEIGRGEVEVAQKTNLCGRNQNMSATEFKRSRAIVDYGRRREIRVDSNDFD